MEDLIHTYPAGAVLAILFVLILVWAITMYIWDDKLKRERRSHQVERLRHGRVVSELRESLLDKECEIQLRAEFTREWRVRATLAELEVVSLKHQLAIWNGLSDFWRAKYDRVHAKYAPFMVHGKNQVRVNGRFGPKKEDA